MAEAVAVTGTVTVAVAVAVTVEVAETEVVAESDWNRCRSKAAPAFGWHWALHEELSDGETVGMLHARSPV